MKAWRNESMNGKRVIFWICPGFAASETDTQCIPPLQLLAKALAKADRIQLKIIALHYPYTRKPYSWYGIPVIPFHSKFTIKRPINLLRSFNLVKRYHQGNPISYIHSFWMTDTALLGYIIQKRLKIPHYVTLGGQDVKPTNKYLKILPAQKMKTIAVSKYQAGVWQDTTGQSPDRIIPWGLPKINNQNDRHPRDVDVLGVGNLIGLKDFALFIDLIYRYQKTYSRQIKAVLIGDGVKRADLQEKIARLGLQESVRLAGSLPREEVIQWMRRSKVLLHPSRSESFGFVFVEALANGMRIVSRKVGVAFSDPQWFLGHDQESLYESLLMALDQFKPARPRYPFPIQDTVKRYSTLYGV